MSIVVCDPTQDPDQEAVATYEPAPRLATLERRTLGLFNNSKLNAAAMLELIRGELEQDGPFDVVRGVYDAAALMPADAWGEVGRCDAVILANGDCGACSTSGIVNAIELEKRGIPTVLVSTPPFVEAVRMSAALRGMPTITWAVVDHPLASLEEAELRDRAQAAARQVRELLLERAPTPA